MTAGSVEKTTENSVSQWSTGDNSAINSFKKQALTRPTQ